MAAVKRDPGLQPERTTLAWRRTAAALMVNGILVLRSGMQEHGRWLLMLGGLISVFALAMMLMADWRAVRLATHADAPSAKWMFLTTSGTLVACWASVATLMQ